MNTQLRGEGSATHAPDPLGTVGDSMTTDLVLIEGDASLGAALRELDRADVTGAPVVDGETVVGVISTKDLYSALPKGVAVATTGPFHRWENYLDEHDIGIRVHEVMHGREVMVTADMPLSEAARTLLAHHMTRVPVVDERKRAVGILSRQDIVSAVARSGR